MFCVLDPTFIPPLVWRFVPRQYDPIPLLRACIYCSSTPYTRGWDQTFLKNKNTHYRFMIGSYRALTFYTSALYNQYLFLLYSSTPAIYYYLHALYAHLVFHSGFINKTPRLKDIPFLL